MHSLRSKVALLTVCVTMIAVIIVSLFSVVFIIQSEHHRSDQLLLLLCETGERNLDYYFSSVEKSIKKVAEYAEEDLESMEDDNFSGHVDRVRKHFDLVAHRTNGVLTYYYRIDPDYSKTEKGFWYTDLYGEDFEEHEVTDITDYDTSDTTKLVWFTVPKATGKPVWLPPYITDNLDKRVISYNIPIFHKGTFVGVVGIEIDYSTMAEQVESIRLYRNGYAFINDSNGKLIFHPNIDVAALSEDELPETPDGLMADSTFVTYKFQGEERKAAWLELENGMRLNVTVPVSEMNGEWKTLVRNILAAAIVVMILLIILAMRLTNHITKPLQDLMDAAEQVKKGNYDFDLKYNEDDEVGRLTGTFKDLAGNVKEHINSLNKQVYVDALTSVRNRGGFSSYLEELQNRLDESGGNIRYAAGVFDCDNLKAINDTYGHEKGDIYLKNASRLICQVFQHSPVFRIGGDEFSVMLQNDDFNNREELTETFEKEMERINAETDEPWNQVHITMGMASYDPKLDQAVIDTVRRADKNMYENKRKKKVVRE